jgi:hypothetical protein
LPYAQAIAQQSVSVFGYRLTMTRLPSYVVAGTGVMFSGRLTVDNTGVGGEEVRIQYCLSDRPDVCYDIASVITGPDGWWYYDWSPPHAMACRTYLFRAVHPASGATSDSQAMSIAYPTRIRDFSAPSRVGVGAPFTVSGRLEYEESPGTWRPLAGRTVSIYYDNVKLTDVTTASDGSFSATVSISTPGTYTLRAHYAGEGLTAAAMAIAGVEIPGYAIPLVGVGAVVAFIAIPILANALKK